MNNEFVISKIEDMVIKDQTFTSNFTCTTFIEAMTYYIIKKSYYVLKALDVVGIISP